MNLDTADPTNIVPAPRRPDDKSPVRGAVRDRHSYQRSSAVAGRPIAEWVYLVILAAAGAADVAAFYSVVTLVLRADQDWLIWMLIGGLTALALSLAHFAGRFVRDVAAECGKIALRSARGCIIPWMMLGAASIAVRAFYADSSPVPSFSGGVIADHSNTKYGAAILFGMLYLASGFLCAVGEFATRNPLRGEYRHCLRNHKRAQKRLAKSQPHYQRAMHVRELHLAGMRQDPKRWIAAQRIYLAYGEELKRHAAVLIAAQLKNPSATDGMTEPDWRPLRPRAAQTVQTSPGIDAQPEPGSTSAQPVESDTPPTSPEANGGPPAPPTLRLNNARKFDNLMES